MPVVVTVNVTQRESAIRGVPKNASGLPKPLCLSANCFHNAHDRRDGPAAPVALPHRSTESRRPAIRSSRARYRPARRRTDSAPSSS